SGPSPAVPAAPAQDVPEYEQPESVHRHRQPHADRQQPRAVVAGPGQAERAGHDRHADQSHQRGDPRPVGRERARGQERRHAAGGDDQRNQQTVLHSQYSDPVLSTGCAARSPHSTTSRLLTMVALRSSSSSTTPLFCSSSSAISTMPQAPATIRARAATTALACWRCSIAWAISGAYARWLIFASSTSTPAEARRSSRCRLSSSEIATGWLRSDIWSSSCWS